MSERSRVMLSIKESENKVIRDLQDFLEYKRKTCVDFGSRLLEPFSVQSCSSLNEKSDTIVVNFKGKDRDHYWVNKKEFYDFLNGYKKLGAELVIDKEYVDNGHIAFELRLTKNGLSTKSIHDSVKFKGLIISHNNKLYKAFDVQVKMDTVTQIENTIRVFVTELETSESFINSKVVVKDNFFVTKGDGMTIKVGGDNTQEEFVAKADALKAILIERNNVIKDINLWLQELAEMGVENAEEVLIEYQRKFLNNEI